MSKRVSTGGRRLAGICSELLILMLLSRGEEKRHFGAASDNTYYVKTGKH
jgi:hypothetical protein